MKNLSVILVLAGLLLSGCGTKELSKEEALLLIRKEKGFPRVVDHDIFCADPEYAKEVLDKGLEQDGFVIVHRTLKLGEVGSKPIIEFSAKAKPYLLPTPAEKTKYKIQKVRIADEDVLEIKSIVPDKDAKTAVVTYTTIYKNISPFAVLLQRNIKEPSKDRTATFALSDQDGWILQKNR